MMLVDKLQILPASGNQFLDKNFLLTLYRAEKPKIMQINRKSHNMVFKESQPRKSRTPSDVNKYRLVKEEFSICRNPCLSTATLQKWVYNIFRMRDDYGFVAKQLRECFSKKKAFFNELKTQELASQKVKCSSNDDGKINYLDESGINLEEDFPMTHHQEKNIDQEKFDLTLHDSLLDDGVDEINEPDFVDPLEIDYVKDAKKVNIKYLKKGMWDLILKESQTISFDSHTTNCSNEKKVLLTFRDLKEKLPKYIKSDLSENLTVCNLFVSLLHLCNDKVPLKLLTFFNIFSNIFFICFRNSLLTLPKRIVITS